MLIWILIGPVTWLMEGATLAPEKMVLENPQLRLAFDEATGALVELSAPARGFSCLAPGVPAPPVEMQIWDREKGAVVPLPGGEPTLQDHRITPSSLVLSFTLAEGRILAECEIRLDGSELSHWRARVTNHSPFSVVSVSYPNVPAQVGPESADDVLVFPLVYGERQINPLQLGGARCAYPGPASMSWMDLYDAAGGLYLASYDQTCQSTDVSAGPFPATEPRALLMSFTKFGLIAPGQTWESADFIVALHAGDWHWGADQYRQWRDSWMQRPPTPPWLRDSEGWMGVGYHAAFPFALRGSYEETLPQAAVQAAELGLNHLEVWGQMIAPQPAKHNCGLYVAADPAQGGAEALAQVNQQLRAQGFQLGYYLHAWASSPGLDTLIGESVRQLPPEETEPSWKVTDPDSQTADPAGNIATGHIRVMCPGASHWQEYLRFWVLDRYVRQYGSTGMYLDVLAIHHDRCFSEKHGPLHIGEWGRQVLRILQSLRQEGPQMDPDFFLASEGVCDVYGQYVDVQLISRSCMTGSWVPHPFPEMIRYTCPDLMLLEGFANGLGPTPGTTQEATPEYVIQHCHLFGNRYDYYELGEPGALDYLKRALALRRQFKDFLYRARFMDEVGLTVSPGLQAKWFAAPEGPGRGVLITLVNAEERENLAVSLSGLPSPAGPGATVYALDRPPQPLTVAQTDDTVRFTAPREAMSAVWLQR